MTNCNYKVKITDIQNKYRFKIFCATDLSGYYTKDETDTLLNGKQNTIDSSHKLNADLVDDTNSTNKFVSASEKAQITTNATDIEELQEENENLNLIVDQMPKVTDEGEIITLNNTISARMNIGLKGNTSQDGEPTPDNPVNVKVVTGNNEIVVCGKNLFDGELELGSYGGGSGEKALANDNYRNKNIISVKPSTTYTFSINGIKQKYVILTYGSTQNFKQQILNDTGTFTTANDVYYINFRCYQADYTSNYATLKVQLEENNQATEYEPYQSQNYPLNLGTIELCKIENYQDYIYKDNDKWYKYEFVGKHTFTGNEENISLQSINSYGIANFFVPISNLISTPLKCSHLMEQFTGISDTQTEGMLGTVNGPYLRLNSSRANNVADFKTWLGTNRPVVYYRLRTPITTQITDTTLISQLNAIEKAISYSSQTNIAQTNADKPFVLDASALLDLNTLINAIVSLGGDI